MLKLPANLRLRTKFLVSLVLIISGLTCTTLLVVRHTAWVQIQREIAEDARGSLLIFEMLRGQQHMTLTRSADLVAALPSVMALMITGDAETTQNSTEYLLHSANADLLALADSSGKIIALHTTLPEIPVDVAEITLRQWRSQGNTAGWWVSGGHIFQVALQPIVSGAPPNTRSLGTVIVGREINVRAAHDLSRICSSQVVFRHGSNVLVSSLSSLDLEELKHQLSGPLPPEQIRIVKKQFFTRSIELSPGGYPGTTLILLKSYTQALAYLERLNRLLLALGLIAVFAACLICFVISDTFTRPLENLVQGVRAVELGDFTYPLESRGGDEVAEVTGAFARMRGTLQSNEAKRQQLEDQLRQSQKMEALGRLAGGVAHDFNNLLTVIKGHCDLILERLDPADPSHSGSQQIRKAADRAVVLTRQLLAFSRSQVLQPGVLDLNALIGEMDKLLPRLIREDIEFVFRQGVPLGRVKADPGQVEQVILNLTVNACDAMPQGGKLTIETRNVTVDAEYASTRPTIQQGSYVMLATTDTGHGMDAANKARIFEPFFTTKEKGKGTGLGLATVYGVVKQSGGFIWVDSVVAKGTCFEIYLPHIDAPVDSSVLETPTAPISTRAEAVLVVEDELEVRDLASEFLRSAGYMVLTACNGTEALALVKLTNKKIDLLLTDVVMPKMRGTELAQRLKAARPRLKVLYMSGYPEQHEGTDEFFEEQFIQKPFSRQLLLNKIGEALRRERVGSVTQTTPNLDFVKRSGKLILPN